MPLTPCRVNSAFNWSMQARHWRVLTNHKPEFLSTSRPRSTREFSLLIGQNPGNVTQYLACINQSEATSIRRGRNCPPKVLHYISLLNIGFSINNNNNLNKKQQQNNNSNKNYNKNKIKTTTITISLLLLT